MTNFTQQCCICKVDKGLKIKKNLAQLRSLNFRGILAACFTSVLKHTARFKILEFVFGNLPSREKQYHKSQGPSIHPQGTSKLKLWCKLELCPKRQKRIYGLLMGIGRAICSVDWTRAASPQTSIPHQMSFWLMILRANFQKSLRGSTLTLQTLYSLNINL